MPPSRLAQEARRSSTSARPMRSASARDGAVISTMTTRIGALPFGGAPTEPIGPPFPELRVLADPRRIASGETLERHGRSMVEGVDLVQAGARGQRPTPEQREWLKRGLEQPGGKLPLFDRYGQS